MKLLVALVMVGLCAEVALSLDCYHCHYYSEKDSTDSKCEKKPKPPGLKACDKSFAPSGMEKALSSLSGNGTSKAMVEKCIKIYAKLDKKVEVFRGCREIDDSVKNECATVEMESDIGKASATVCYCADNECNSSSALSVSFASIVALFLGSAIYAKLQS